MIILRNHKTSKIKLNGADLEKSVGKKVEHGWSLLLTIDSVHHINNVVVVPLGVAEHFSINEKGGCYIKRHVTHKVYFPDPSGVLVNNRVFKDTLQPCSYLLFLLIIIHMIAAM